MALITIAKKSVARHTASLCTRVKLDFVCLYPTDSQMWSSNSLRVIFPCSKTPGLASSEFVLTLRFLWIFPSPVSSASQSLHMNRYLVKIKPASQHTCMINMKFYRGCGRILEVLLELSDITGLSLIFLSFLWWWWHQQGFRTTPPSTPWGCCHIYPGGRIPLSLCISGLCVISASVAFPQHVLDSLASPFTSSSEGQWWLKAREELPMSSLKLHVI